MADEEESTRFEDVRYEQTDLFLETEKNLSESEIKELQILKFARDVESNRVTNNEMSSKPKRLSLTDVRLKRVKA